MARQLWLLRHGEAEPHGTRSDSDRRLTDKGERQARLAGRALARLGIRLELALTSPKVRAHDTAVLACEALGVEAVDHEALTSFDRDEALALLAGCSDEARVLVVGHEPDFSQTVYDLTGARIDMKKGGVAGVRVDGGSAELVALLRPRELEAIASG